MSGNVVAAPLLDTFWSTFWSSNYAYYISFRSLGSQESKTSNSTQIGVETKKLRLFEDNYVNNKLKCRNRTPISQLLDTFLEHFLELKLCIPYFISNLGKSRVQCFKRCSIWSWNEEVMSVWRQARKAKAGISQLQNHPLAHECHFAALYSHFAAAKWVAKIPLREILPPLQKWPPSFKKLRKCSGLQNGLRNSPLAAKWFHSPIATPCQILHLLRKWPFDCEMISKLRNGLRKCFFFPFGWKMDCENISFCSLASKWLRNDLQATKLTYEMGEVCENTLRSQGKLRKCQ